jgi:hypothetical protein
MEPLTLFTWGYWGWGTATDQLIKAVDAVEASRGYQPPLFVDIRISRSVRAPGFSRRAFEQKIGANRYRWFEDLGNSAVVDGGSMRIKNPAAAERLLDIATACARNRQRVLFFCSCEFPHSCHRSEVASLVLKVARARETPIEIIEWPGGEPQLDGLEVKLAEADFKKMERTNSIPLGEAPALAEVAAVAWGSIVTVRQEGNESADVFRLVTGPARYKKSGWYFPVFTNAGELPTKTVRKEVQIFRHESGFEPRRA